MEYPGFAGNIVPADALAPKVARASAGDPKCEYIIVTFKTIQHVKS